MKPTAILLTLVLLGSFASTSVAEAWCDYEESTVCIRTLGTLENPSWEYEHGSLDQDCIELINIQNFAGIYTCGFKLTDLDSSSVVYEGDIPPSESAALHLPGESNYRLRTWSHVDHSGGEEIFEIDFDNFCEPVSTELITWSLVKSRYR